MAQMDEEAQLQARARREEQIRASMECVTARCAHVFRRLADTEIADDDESAGAS
jgi:hypothetical protein